MKAYDIAYEYYENRLVVYHPQDNGKAIIYNDRVVVENADNGTSKTYRIPDELSEAIGKVLTMLSNIVQYKEELIEKLNKINKLLESYKSITSSWSYSRVLSDCRELNLDDCLDTLKLVIDDKRWASRHYRQYIVEAFRNIDYKYGDVRIKACRDGKHYCLLIDDMKVYILFEMIPRITRTLVLCSNIDCILDKLVQYRSEAMVNGKHRVVEKLDVLINVLVQKSSKVRVGGTEAANII